MVTVMRPPHGLVRACLRGTVPATTDTTDRPRRCVTNEADANRPTIARICCQRGPPDSNVIAVPRSLHLFEFHGERRCAVSDLADLPRGLLSLEQWDALELDPTRRWELSEGTLIMSPRPQLWHQRIS